MQQQSNTYIIIFTAATTFILGGLLSFASVTLRPLQIKQEALATKKKILGTVMDISQIEEEKVLDSLYDACVESFLLNIDGERQTPSQDIPSAERIGIQKNHKIAPKERYFPVYAYKSDSDSKKIDAYIFPMFGAGLWDWISCYIALEGDLNTVQGIVFDHKSETPGLGARITTSEVQQRFAQKKLFDVQGALQSITMIKGEKGAPLDDYHVDGISGATMTGKGVNNMLREYLQYYQPYIEKERQRWMDSDADDVLSEDSTALSLRSLDHLNSLDL